MNVLFMTHSYPRAVGDVPGSFILRLAQALAGEGVSVRVVAPSAEGLEGHEVLGGIPVDRFRYAPRQYENLAYGGNMAALVQKSWSARFAMVGFLGSEFQAGVRARREFQPELVHAHWWFPNGVAAAWVARMAGIPLVTTMHGTDVRMARNIAVSRPIFRHVLAQSAAVTTVSRWLADETQSIVSTKSPIVAPMPVEADAFEPGAAADRTKNLLFVGRLMKQKGLDLLIDALVHLPTDVGLDVVGDGPDRALLETRANTLGVGARITWHGAVPTTAMPSFYRRAAALVVPSSEEGLGLVAVEAQLCETPVVAFASGGLPDVIQDGRTGVLVNERDSGALAAAITALFARADRGAMFGGAGRLHALATFTPQAVARRYADIYRSVLERPTP
jgi:glycosyltransferase involved in cell wall biosynthesis